MRNRRAALDDARQRLALDLDIYRGLLELMNRSGLDVATENEMKGALKIAESNLRMSARNLRDAAEARGLST